VILKYEYSVIKALTNKILLKFFSEVNEKLNNSKNPKFIKAFRSFLLNFSKLEILPNFCVFIKNR